MLTLRIDLFEAMVAHCRAEHPVEACGIMPGPARGDVPDRIVPMVNADEHVGMYRFDPEQQIAVWVEMGERGERPVVIYHSHTGTRAYPSKVDVAFAVVPEAHYVIVSNRDGDGDLPMPPEVRSFRIVAGCVTEETIAVI